MYKISNPLDFVSLVCSNIFQGCVSLNTVSFQRYSTPTCILPEETSILGEGTFQNCSQIREIIISSNITNVPKFSFRNCYNLEKIHFESENISLIGESAFENCVNINNVIFPKYLNSIGIKSFNNCLKIDNMIFDLKNSVINFASSSFSNCSQLLQENNSVIFSNNEYVKNYFVNYFPKTKQLSIENLVPYKKYFNRITNLLNSDYSNLKKIFFPSFDVKLTKSKQIVTTDLVSSLVSDINISKMRRLILNFIFEINNNYNNFIINNNRLKITNTLTINNKNMVFMRTITENSSYFVNVYSESATNIDTSVDIDNNKNLVIYGLLSRNYSELNIDDYKVRLSLNSNGRYDAIYSSDNFTSVNTLLSNGDNNSKIQLTNYNIITGTEFIQLSRSLSRSLINTSKSILFDMSFMGDYIVLKNNYVIPPEEENIIKPTQPIMPSIDLINNPVCVSSRCRGCNKNLTGNDPASQYQRQKIIQNTVRVKSSLYTMNLAGLSCYQKPLNVPQVVSQAGTMYTVPANTYWNQMSDRSRPSVNRSYGVGVDIKHNSYERYLLKMKGKGPLRKGTIPSNFGEYITFDRASPVYGGKTMNTSIVSGCHCQQNSERIIYNNPLNNIVNELLSIKYIFHIGDYVWAKQYFNSNILYKGKIIDIYDGIYTVEFDDTIKDFGYCDLLVYFDCDACVIYQSVYDQLLSTSSNPKELQSKISSDNNIYCQIINLISVQGGLF